MARIKITKDKNGTEVIKMPLEGKELITNNRFNKGCAFTRDERMLFGLLGKLPHHVEILEDQVERLYQQYNELHDPLRKHVFLSSLHDYNMTLFYKLVSDHLVEMLPIIYTPTIGDAVEKYSLELRQPYGTYIAYPDRDNIDTILDNRSNEDIDLIVVTDGEGVLGIGDQGVGGMKISIGKLMVYTLCAGISPFRVLPLQLDVGTNNEKLLQDRMYLGWRHRRIEGKAYDEFIEAFVQAVEKKFPGVYLHWEDFGRENARRILNHYRKDICTFNDDIQGTGTTALATILRATKLAKTALTDNRIVVFGAGTAGAGVADMICMAMREHGLSDEEAHKRMYLIDRDGLITERSKNLPDFQAVYQRKETEVEKWKVENPDNITLAEVVKNAKPTILIGCSAVTGAFTKEIIEEMITYTEHPIIMPLSNPTSRSEANPQDLLDWTDGKAFIAAGSPFEKVTFKGEHFTITQCNNAYTFPGLGLGVIVSKAERVTDKMIIAACYALSESIGEDCDIKKGLLPPFNELKYISKKIAFAVAKEGIKEKLATKMSDKELEEAIDEYYWEPNYYPYIKANGK